MRAAPDRRTLATFAVLGLLTAGVVVGMLALDLGRHSESPWPAPVPVMLGFGLVAGLAVALAAPRMRRRPVLLPVAGVAIGLLVGSGVDLWRRYGPSPDVQVTYHGRYVLLDGQNMSRAYSSTLVLTPRVAVTPWSLLLTGAVAGLVAGLIVAVVARRFALP